MAGVVRRAGIADAATIAEIQVRSRHAAHRGLVPDEVLERVTVSDRTGSWDELLEQGSEAYFVVGAPGSVIGPARDASAPAELAALCVDPGRWRSGLGCTLIATALSWREPASLWFFAANVRALSFHKAQGFTEDGGSQPDTGVLESRIWRPAET
jgi:hypothetical protein